MAFFTDRENCVAIAKLAVDIERYADMVDEMKRVAKMGEELTEEERKLFALGYCKVINRLRECWEILSKLEEKDKEVTEYKQNVGGEAIEVCKDILSILEEHLIPSSISNPDASVFYYKLKGDYSRYLADFQTGSDRDEAADEALNAYKTATTTAVAELPRADPIRLELDLNHAVFYDEILHLPEKAYQIAEEAIREATPELSSLSDEACIEVSKTLSALKDNIIRWKEIAPVLSDKAPTPAAA